MFGLNANSILNAGPNGTVKLVTVMMTGNTFTSAVGTAAQPLTVAAGNVIVTASSGKRLGTRE